MEEFKPTEIESLAIKQMVLSGLTDAQIAKKLKTKKARISEFLSSENIKREKVNKLKKAGFSSETKSGKKVGIAISTQSSSQKGDEFNNQRHNQKSLEKYKDSIHYIDQDGKEQNK